MPAAQLFYFISVLSVNTDKLFYVNPQEKDKQRKRRDEFGCLIWLCL